MFWNKIKQTLKDKDAGLVFNWRNSFPLRYPLPAFILLSLIAHFFFLQVFKFPEHPKEHHSINTGSVLFLSDKNSPDIQRVLARAQTLGIATPRGSALVDPLTQGIENQLTGPLNAGLHDWSPLPKPYPTLPFEETGANLFFWEHGIPPVNTTYLANEGIKTSEPSSTYLSVSTNSPELQDALPVPLPKRKSSPDLLGKSVSFMLHITRDGDLFLITPINNDSGLEKATKEGESWLRSLSWQPSRNGVEGFINLTWKGEKDA